VAAGHSLLVTRTGRDAYDAVLKSVPGAVYHELARCISLDTRTTPSGRGTIVVAAAGTADLPIAEGAAV
jgi:NCAIR mutase (PurE)-related protein